MIVEQQNHRPSGRARRGGSRRRRSPGVVRAVAVGLALTVTAACSGSSGGGEAGDGGRVKITWQAAPFGDRADDARKYLVKDFEREHPGIDVEVVSAPTNVDTNRAGLTTQIMGRSATPDVFNGDVAWAAQFAAAGLVLPIGEHVPKSFWDRFDPATVEGASYGGTVYGVPLTLDQGFLYYRKDLLAKHHLPVPATWEEVARQSKILSDAGDVDYGLAWQGASYEGLTAVTNEFVQAGGGTLVDADGTRSGAGSGASADALAFMKKLIGSGVSPRATTTFQEPQSLQAFTGGSAAFLRNWSYAYDTADAKGTKTAGKVGVTGMPAFDTKGGKHASSVGGWNVYVNPHTQHQKAALEFVTWLTSPKVQRLMAERSSTIPTVDSVRESPEVRKLSAVLRASSGNDLVSRPTTSRYYPQISQATSSTVNSMLSGGLSPSDASKRLASDIEAALAGRRL
ncbi:ABC transporter substrate-binding protein [Streptomyces sp. NPDC088725]|uniref:ABC transporter substrate-binding protein n=1 Tax=Streptomyces sp. NPDC088725 TaxID=3365873 RepID=UPI00381198B9